MESKTMKVVFAITERNGKSFWTRIGIGSTNRDGSLNLALDAIPVNGKLQVRDWQPQDARPAGASDADGASQGATPPPPFLP